MKNCKLNNILEKALEIVYVRNTEKTRDYGPFDESMASAAVIASELTGKNITTEDFYKCMMALKLARLKYSSKEDTFLDLVAYTAALHKRIEDNENPLINEEEADVIKGYKPNYDTNEFDKGNEN